MRIHYNNGKKEKILTEVLSISVIDGNTPVVALLKNGNELKISLNNIEMILDEEIFMEDVQYDRQRSYKGFGMYYEKGR